MKSIVRNLIVVKGIIYQQNSSRLQELYNIILNSKEPITVNQLLRKNHFYKSNSYDFLNSLVSNGILEEIRLDNLRRTRAWRIKK